MKLFNYIHIITGHNCLYLITNIILTIILIFSWKYKLFITVSSILVMIYIFIFILMLLIQHNVRLYKLSDSLEEFTTSYYFSTYVLGMLLVSHLIHNNLLIICLGILLLAGPAIISLLPKDIKK